MYTTGVKCALYYLGKVFVKLWVKQCHLWLHILIQHQREHWEHGVDCSVAVNISHAALPQHTCTEIHTERHSCSHCLAMQMFKRIKDKHTNSQEARSLITYPTMRKPWYRGTDAK